MRTCLKIFFFSAFVAIACGRWAAAEELEPFFPKSRAPIDIRKGAGPTIGAMSASDLREFKGEFGGILYMGQKPYTFDRWPGKEISDCRKVSAGNACEECELIMGHSSADYYFFKDSSQRCTLQQIDAHFQASDSNLLKTLKGPAQMLLGQATKGSKPASTEPGWGGAGQGWKWEDEADLAYLYMDVDQASENTEGVARFQWRRTPLYKPSR